MSLSLKFKYLHQSVLLQDFYFILHGVANLLNNPLIQVSTIINDHDNDNHNHNNNNNNNNSKSNNNNNTNNNNNNNNDNDIAHFHMLNVLFGTLRETDQTALFLSSLQRMRKFSQAPPM